MKAFIALVAREVRLAWTGGGLWLPVIFYLAVATLFPFVTGPDKALLARRLSHLPSPCFWPR